MAKARKEREGMAFDALHAWSGNEVATESPEFQAGKAWAFEKILPYAHEQSRHEAAAVVLRVDGSAWDFEKGLHGFVSVGIPTAKNTPVALLHSHPHVLAHSVTDWQTLLLSDNVVQSYVICDGKTYALHKPRGWQKPKGLTKQDVADSFFSALIDAFDAIEARGETQSDRKEREEALRILAWQYGVQWRIGEHLNRE